LLSKKIVLLKECYVYELRRLHDYFVGYYYYSYLKRSNGFRVPIPAKPAERQFSFNDASPFLPCFYTSASSSFRSKACLLSGHLVAGAFTIFAIHCNERPWHKVLDPKK
jgi:hypothetical protein